MREWFPPGEWRRMKREEAARSSGHSLATAEERATLSKDDLQCRAYNRWMSLRFTGRAPAVNLIIVGDVASKQHQITKEPLP